MWYNVAGVYLSASNYVYHLSMMDVVQSCLDLSWYIITSLTNYLTNITTLACKNLTNSDWVSIHLIKHTHWPRKVDINRLLETSLELFCSNYFAGTSSLELLYFTRTTSLELFHMMNLTSRLFSLEFFLMKVCMYVYAFLNVVAELEIPLIHFEQKYAWLKKMSYVASK